MATVIPEPSNPLYCAICEQQFTAGELCPNDGTKLVRLVAPADPLLGRDLDGRYTIIEKLGQGGMGSVYRAKQHSMGREVAIKVVSPALTSDAATIKRFLREAKLASRLAHPNIVSVFEFGQTSDGLFYLVMELVNGRTLHHVIHEEGRITVSRLVRIASQICDALEGAHALPIIHRDLKPANVMLLAQGRDLVKVLDFGLAKSLSPDSGAGSTMTSAGALMGTPTFMPPEVANGQHVDHRADLYSLGCILYLMGAGRPPFVTESVPEMIAMHGTQPAPPMVGVPAPIAAVIDRLLRKHPSERYQSAAALRVALEDAHDASRTHAVADTLDEQLDPTTVNVTAAPPRATSHEGTSTYLIPDVSIDAPSLAEPPSAAIRASVPLVLDRPKRERTLLYALAPIAALVAIVIVVVVMSRESRSKSAPDDAAPAIEPIVTDEIEVEIDAGVPVVEIDAGLPATTTKPPTTKPKRPKRPKRKPEAPF